jgi:hypothetical protein
LQVQFVTTELPAGELEFDGQTMHVEFTEDPTAVEYVPSPHCVHVEDPLIFWYEPDEHKVMFGLQAQLLAQWEGERNARGLA